MRSEFFKKGYILGIASINTFILHFNPNPLASQAYTVSLLRIILYNED